MVSDFDYSSYEYNQLLNKKQYCDLSLLKKCNAKWGISDDVVSSLSDLISQFDNDSELIPKNATDNAYGWFNEVCINEGFAKPKRVVAHKVLNGAIRGKCVVDNTISAKSEDCLKGGNVSKDCYCFDAKDYDISYLGINNVLYEIRYETPREAGLCIDMPRPKICPATSYPLNSNQDDIYFTGIEYGLNSDEISDIHESHIKRSTENIGNADFSLFLVAMMI